VSEQRRRRVVITGMGAICPVGESVPAIWDAVKNGRSGVAPITLFDACEHKTRFAAEVKDFRPEDHLDKKEYRHMDRFMHFGVAAARLALEDCGLQITGAFAERVGCIVGNCLGGATSFEQEVHATAERGIGRVSPYFVLKLISDIAAGHIAMLTGAKGMNYAIASSCASAAHAIGCGLRHIQHGDADVMICGGAEAPITSVTMAGLNALRALSTRNDDFEHASRPFDKLRDGFVLGEGAGMLVLEEREAARRRGASILAELVGFGFSNDVHHITAPAPSGEGFARAMQGALSDAGIAPAQVGYINAHGTSTRYNDATETLAIKTVFGEHARRLRVSSTKSCIGHLVGASGAVELIVSVMALRNSFIPPTINQTTPDELCDLDYCPNVGVTAELHAVLSNSFGFGGHNASLLIRRVGEA
jgi:3-oxoacyl-[acyl-carrier-protein] synthase II